MKQKLSLYEWYAKEEGELVSESSEFIRGLLNNGSTVHFGDCTGHSCPCDLCVLSRILDDYSEYIFDKEHQK